MQKLYQNTAFKALAIVLFIAASVTMVFSAFGLLLISEGPPYALSQQNTSSVDETLYPSDTELEVFYDAYGNQISYYYDSNGEVVFVPPDVGITVDDGSLPTYVYYIAADMEGFLTPLLIISVIICLAAFIFLMCSAGRRRGEDEIKPNHLDRVPLDIFLAIAIGISALLLYLAEEASYYLAAYISLSVLLIIVAIFSLLVLATFMSLATRFKLGKWWQNTIIYKLILRPIGKVFVWAWRKIKLVFGSLSLLWKCIVSFIALGIIGCALCTNWAHGSGGAGFFLFLLGVITLVMLCLAMIQMNTLKLGARRMADGNLNYRVDTRNMFKDLKEHGNNLNRISDGMAAAVEERMKSEHFKTELITNVSHDLKTPLTSIINYVDLLQKENIKNPKAGEYLEVLSRQSARLKKLTEDLVEASKASTGNVTIELANTDMNELVRQLMGEYEERFREVDLASVVAIPDDRLVIMADGRSLWRIFDNLLNNICKYSQPHTRVFVDLSATRERVSIAIKNTSRELLNIPADDLLERFVRGDKSRNSEGSGLGLSIARSLTELQGGKLELEVDGDLFKVKISFDRVYD